MAAPDTSSPTPSPAHTKISRRGLLKAGVRSGIVFSGAALGALVWANRVEPWRIQVEEVELKLSRLAPAFDGYRIAHISDFHLDTSMAVEVLQLAIARINTLKPDCVVLTGDYVSNKVLSPAQALVTELPKLQTRDGVFAVMGNHDYWHGPRKVKALLKQGRVRELENEVHRLRRGESTLALCGVDDYAEGHADLERVMAQLPADAASILLAHESEYADISAPTGRFDVQLSGHSHGGQVRLPGWGPIHLPQFARKYHTGLYRVENMWQYTNRGLGVVGLPIRFCCPPEITLLTLRATNRAAVAT
jgi:predicted MPP superfamily phosphohydrolase